MSTTLHVENLLYGGRSLVGHTDEGERIAGWPEVAYESIRAINHLTDHGPIPPRPPTGSSATSRASATCSRGRSSN